MLGPVAPAGLPATPTPNAAAVADAVRTAASFTLSGEILTNLTPTDEME
jgi:hypothetical protein